MAQQPPAEDIEDMMAFLGYVRAASSPESFSQSLHVDQFGAHQLTVGGIKTLNRMIISANRGCASRCLAEMCTLIMTHTSQKQLVIAHKIFATTVQMLHAKRCTDQKCTQIVHITMNPRPPLMDRERLDLIEKLVLAHINHHHHDAATMVSMMIEQGRSALYHDDGNP